ncbi:MAG: hypothetical protein ACRDJN_21045 [Chloroflexota bacterium]
MQGMLVGLLDGLTTLALVVGPVAAVCYVAWKALAAMASGGAKVISEVVTALLTAVVILAIVLGAKTIIIPELRAMMGVFLLPFGIDF